MAHCTSITMVMVKLKWCAWIIRVGLAMQNDSVCYIVNEASRSLLHTKYATCKEKSICSH